MSNPSFSGASPRQIPMQSPRRSPSKQNNSSLIENIEILMHIFKNQDLPKSKLMKNMILKQYQMNKSKALTLARMTNRCTNITDSSDDDASDGIENLVSAKVKLNPSEDKLLYNLIEAFKKCIENQSQTCESRDHSLSDVKIKEEIIIESTDTSDSDDTIDEDSVKKLKALKESHHRLKNQYDMIENEEIQLKEKLNKLTQIMDAKLKELEKCIEDFEEIKTMNEQMAIEYNDVKCKKIEIKSSIKKIESQCKVMENLESEMRKKPALKSKDVMNSNVKTNPRKMSNNELNGNELIGNVYIKKEPKDNENDNVKNKKRKEKSINLIENNKKKCYDNDHETHSQINTNETHFSVRVKSEPVDDSDKYNLTDKSANDSRENFLVSKTENINAKNSHVFLHHKSPNQLYESFDCREMSVPKEKPKVINEIEMPQQSNSVFNNTHNIKFQFHMPNNTNEGNDLRNSHVLINFNSLPNHVPFNHPNFSNQSFISNNMTVNNLQNPTETHVKKTSKKVSAKSNAKDNPKLNSEVKKKLKNKSNNKLKDESKGKPNDKVNEKSKNSKNSKEQKVSNDQTPKAQHVNSQHVNTSVGSKPTHESVRNEDNAKGNSTLKPKVPPNIIFKDKVNSTKSQPKTSLESNAFKYSEFEVPDVHFSLNCSFDVAQNLQKQNNNNCVRRKHVLCMFYRPIGELFAGLSYGVIQKFVLRDEFVFEREFPFIESPVTALMHHDSTGTLYSGNKSGLLRSFDSSTGAVRSKPVPLINPIVCIEKDNTRHVSVLYIGVSAPKSTRVYRYGTMGNLIINVFELNIKQLVALKVIDDSAEENRIVVAGKNCVIICDSKTGTLHATLENTPEFVANVALQLNNTHIIVSSNCFEDGKRWQNFRVFENKMGSKIDEWSRYDCQILAVEAVNDQFIVITSKRRILCYNIINSKFVQKWTAFIDSYSFPTSLTLSKDNVFVGLTDGKVIIITPDKTGPFICKCINCGESFARKSDVTSHFVYSHAIPFIKNIEFTGQRFICSWNFCGEYIKPKEFMIVSHLEGHLNNQYNRLELNEHYHDKSQLN